MHRIQKDIQQKGQKADKADGVGFLPSLEARMTETFVRLHICGPRSKRIIEGHPPQKKISNIDGSKGHQTGVLPLWPKTKLDELSEVGGGSIYLAAKGT